MNILSNISISQFSSQFSSTPPSAIPCIVINWYLKNLWNYEQNSWVATVGYGCRFLAFLLILPIAVLGLLDIVSYGIARTLGIVDDVKASTSDKRAGERRKKGPVTLVDGASSAVATDPSRQGQPIMSSLRRASQPDVFYASEDNNLRLSGVDVFSPAVSREPTPPETNTQGSSFKSKRSEKKGDTGGEGLRQRSRRSAE